MKNLIIILLFFLIPFSNSEWQLKKEKDGIEIYTRNVEGSSFLEFKAVMILKNVGLTDVLDIILDVENYESLYADCMNPKVLKTEGKYYDIHYIQTKGPLTVKDRDGVYEQVTKLENNGKHAIVYLKPLPDYIEENKNMVRIRNGTGFWELEENKENEIKVVYQFHGEPGGDIPAWLANSFVVSHPFKTMKNLKIRLGVE
jgi:hypothetical protein